MPSQPQAFGSLGEFAAWLDANHGSADEVWVALPKKGTEVPSVTRAEALDVALCYGWIDGQARSNTTPDGWWAMRFTPRRPRGTWSQVNCARVLELIDAGRMRPAGQAQIDQARADGRWAAAYAPQSRAEVPPELAAALAAVPAAEAAFTALRATERYQILLTLQKLKRPESRERRIREYVARLAGQA